MTNENLVDQSARQIRTLFDIAREQDASTGSKAYNLAVLKAGGFSVPDAVVLNHFPGDSEFREILKWWESIGRPALAVRSSALGEDGAGASFAGQLSSVLQVETPDGLYGALKTCFESGSRAASLAYQKHFARPLKTMNVVVQRMIAPKFSGVFFSFDPRGHLDSWIVEATTGTGEKLVSGEVTPFRFANGLANSLHPEGWVDRHLNAVVDAGQRTSKFLGFPVDMEWAIDSDDRFWLLQARPVTTHRPAITADEILERELARLNRENDKTTLWDANTFVEWTGLPSPLSAEVWREAFGPSGAFIQALRVLGYAAKGDTNSLLDLIYGRPCLNLSRLEPMFFGQTPYRMVLRPKTHMEFDWHRVNLPTILQAPQAIGRMVSVAWNLQQHAHLKERTEKALGEFIARQTPTLDSQDLTLLLEELDRRCLEFSRQTLIWPFVLAMAIESNLGTLETAIAKDMGTEKANSMIQSWMASELKTVSGEMLQAFEEACSHPETRREFLAKYGHRGPGELDLSHQRWGEMGDEAFANHSVGTHAKLDSTFESDLKTRIHPIRRPYIEREWAALKSLLELREQWKMASMKDYAFLRTLLLRIGRVTGIGENIFFLQTEELKSMSSADKKIFADKAAARKRESDVFRKISLPISFSLSELNSRFDSLLSHAERASQIQSPQESKRSQEPLTGEPLSPGIASGEVRIVTDPATVDLSTWPENTILVAEATDPGWTPLFQRAVGIVVERGGVLSHCAIVAREMGIPAVSQISQCCKILKDGDHVWIDGNLGRVGRTENH